MRIFIDSNQFAFFFLLAGLTQASCNCIVMVALEKPSVDKMQRATDLEMLKKLFGLSLIRGKDKNTNIRAIIVCSLIEHGYIKIEDNADLAYNNLTRNQDSVAVALFLVIVLSCGSNCVLYCDVALRRLGNWKSDLAGVC